MFNLTRTQNRRIVHGLSYLFLTLVGVSMVLPLLWMVLTSLKRPADDVLDPGEWWPRVPWRIEKTDVRSWPRFCARLVDEGNTDTPSPGRRLWELIEERQRRAFVEVSKVDPTPPAKGENPRPDQIILERQFGEMRAALNTVLKRLDFYSSRDFGDPPKAAGDPPRVGAETREIALFNRHVLDAAYPQMLVPTHRFQFENYRIVMTENKLGMAFFNSLLMTVCITFGSVFTSSLAAFAFARLQFAGRDRIFLAYLATMMIPVTVTIIPVFVLLRHLGWVNTYPGLILPGMFTAWGTFMLRQFFMGIPRELEDAAIIDGCSTWGVYRHVVMPLSKPAVAALAMLTFMGVWSEFMWPLIITNTPDMFTLTVALASFKETYNIRWALMMAGAVIMVLPMIIVFIFGQRYFTEGIRLGAVKG